MEREKNKIKREKRLETEGKVEENRKDRRGIKREIKIKRSRKKENDKTK